MIRKSLFYVDSSYSTQEKLFMPLLAPLERIFNFARVHSAERLPVQIRLHFSFDIATTCQEIN